MKQNHCVTYFRIVGNFHPDDVSEILQLKPEKSWKIGDARVNGTKYDFASWEIGRCEEYHIETEVQMQKTIALLRDKTDLLRKIKETYDVDFYLEIVPTISVGSTTPCLAPSLDVIDFCHETRTEIDIDLYVQ